MVCIVKLTKTRLRFAAGLAEPGCAKAVDEPSKTCGRRDRKNNFGHRSPSIQTPERCARPLSRRASLDRHHQSFTIAPPNVTVHRYEEQIAGRTYLIEVSPVSASRWRAQIARRPGMPTSLMPFYGQTPDEAARELSKWLSLVSAPVAANT